jgi:hypothetical protein
MEKRHPCHPGETWVPTLKGSPPAPGYLAWVSLDLPDLKLMNILDGWEKYGK